MPGLAGASLSARTLRRFGASVTPELRYLDFEGAARAVAEAREEAAAIGEPDLAPSLALEDCPERGTIETALATPRISFQGTERYPTLAAKAAVLTYTLAKSQACPDGNKRIALILLRAFLYINAATLVAPDAAVAEVIVRAAESDRTERDAMIDELMLCLENWIATEGPNL
jgi:death-on-curing protein